MRFVIKIGLLLFLNGCVSVSKKEILVSHFKTRISYKKKTTKEAFSTEIFLSPSSLRILITNPLIGSLASVIETKDQVLILDERKKLFLKSSFNELPFFEDLNLPPQTLSSILREEDLSSFSCEKKEDEKICMLEDLSLSLKGKPLKEILFTKEDIILKIKIKRQGTEKVSEDFFNPSLKGWTKATSLSLKDF